MATQHRDYKRIEGNFAESLSRSQGKGSPCAWQGLPCSITLLYTFCNGVVLCTNMQLGTALYNCAIGSHIAQCRAQILTHDGCIYHLSLDWQSLSVDAFNVLSALCQALFLGCCLIWYAFNVGEVISNRLHTLMFSPFPCAFLSENSFIINIFLI